MKTAREIHNGNKNRLNLPLHKLFGWLVRLHSFRLLLESVRWQSLAWFIGLWLVKELITDVIRSAWGCLVFILSFAVVVGIIIWLLIL